MARLWSSGFELNSAGGIEWSGKQGNPAVQTGIVRSGAYALEIASLASATVQALGYTFASSAGNGPYFFRTYFQYSVLPTGDNTIIRLGNTALGTTEAGLKITAGGALKLWNGGVAGAQVGSTSSALTINQWYRLEIKYDNTGGVGAGILELLIDGVSVASSSSLTIALGILSYSLGGNLLAETQTQGDWFFDDIAINDSTGSFQNTYPGDGKIVHLRPSSAGDSTQWTPAAGSNFAQVNEVTPDDVTTRVASATLNQEDLYNVDDSGVGAGATIALVSVGARFANNVADATIAMKLEIEKTSGGTILQSAAIIANSSSYGTNTRISTPPATYPITAYQDPDGGAWTQTTLDSMQVGQKLTAATANSMRLSTIWALVDYVPGAGGDDTISVSDTATTTEGSNVAVALQAVVTDGIQMNRGVKIV